MHASKSKSHCQRPVYLLTQKAVPILKLLPGSGVGSSNHIPRAIVNGAVVEHQYTVMASYIEEA